MRLGGWSPLQPGLLSDEAKASPSRAGRAASVATQACDDPDSHRTEHSLHARPHMVNADRLDLFITQKPCHPAAGRCLAAPR